MENKNQKLTAFGKINLMEYKKQIKKYTTSKNIKDSKHEIYLKITKGPFIIYFT